MRVMVIVKATKESEAENTPLDMEGAAELEFPWLLRPLWIRSSPARAEDGQ